MLVSVPEPTNSELADEWLDRLRPRFGDYATVALENIGKEFPGYISKTMTAPGDFPNRPRDRNPVFYGSFDWHSCVEMFWLLVRLLKTAPDAIPAGDVRQALNARLTPEGLEQEANFMATPGGAAMERPYGWGWVLALVSELETWDDEDARRWAAGFRPLAETLTNNFLAWLPRATYPLRTGVHNNSSFGISRALPYARRLADVGRPELTATFGAAVRRWYLADADYPGGYEPSGHDFLSAGLCEAELVACLLPQAEFTDWLGKFLPGIAAGEPEALFTPAIVSDPSDGFIAHLRGLNLSRAWCWRRVAESLLPNDERVPVCAEAARVHAEASLPYVTGDDYMVEHWLAAYAVLLFS